MQNGIEERVLACESENAKLRRIVFRQNVLWLIALLLIVGHAIIKNPTPSFIKAREIAVVDAKGVVRARLSGDLPDGVMAGGRVSKRGSKAAGLIIYDEEGIERGGYVTQDEGSNAMLTLDSKYKQAALFVAGPDQPQTSALKLWTQGGAIELRSDSDGSRISVFDKSGVTFQQPVIATLSAPTCKAFKELEQEHPGKRICQSRFSDIACKACLDGQ